MSAVVVVALSAAIALHQTRAVERADAARSARLLRTARELGAPGRGILAADESPGTIAKRFKPLGLSPSTETVQAWRQVLFSTPGV